MSENLTFDESSNTLTVGEVDGVDYLVRGVVANGKKLKLTSDTYVTARPQPGKVFPRGTQTRWKFEVNKDLLAQQRSDQVEQTLAARKSAEDAASAADPVETRVQADASAPRGGGTTPSPGTSATSAGASGATGGTP